MITTLVVLSEKSVGQRSLAGRSPGDHKESDMTEPMARMHARTRAHTHTTDLHCCKATQQCKAITLQKQKLKKN